MMMLCIYLDTIIVVPSFLLLYNIKSRQFERETDLFMMLPTTGGSNFCERSQKKVRVVMNFETHFPGHPLLVEWAPHIQN